MSHPESLRFDGRVVLITGAAIGLGRAYAHAFAEKGAHVIVNDLPPAPGSINGAQVLADALNEKGHSAFAVSCSVLEAEDLVQQALSRHGRLDVIVNNAGFLRDAAFHKMTAAEWQDVNDVHLTGAFRVTRAAWPHLRSAHFGRIIMTSSCAGLFGNFGQANYAAAKMGLVGLMQTLGIEGEKNNVRVNCLAPTGATRMMEGILPAHQLAQFKPELVSPAVLALVSENAPNRAILSAGAGGYELAYIALTQGIALGEAATAEQILARWDELADRGDAFVPATGFDQARHELRKAGFPLEA